MTTLVLFTGTLAAAVTWYLHRDTKRAHQARVRRELTRASLAYALEVRRRRALRVRRAAVARDAFGRFARGGIIGHDLSDTRRDRRG